MTSSSHYKQKGVAVVVPYYKTDLTEAEQTSLRHLQRFLGNYDRFLVAPKSLNAGLPGFGVRKFDDEYFLSVLTYNKLMLFPRFYEAFADYEYILLYQLDALVFTDQLSQWCETGYDYVGAPWLVNKDVPEAGFSNVGNGGFSLRKVNSFLRVLRSPGIVIDAQQQWDEFCANNSRISRLWNLHKRYLKRLPQFSNVRWYSKHPHDMEDIFWANIAPRVDPQFRIAPVREALQFSFEQAPRYCFEQNNYKLPFGCHAWEKNERDFWEQYLLDVTK